MDILNINFTGRLTADAEMKIVEKLEKKVFNFTVASNINKEKTVFLECSYWIKDTADQENKLSEMLSKGKQVTIFSDYLSIEKSEGKDGNKYEKLKISVAKISI